MCVAINAQVTEIEVFPKSINFGCTEISERLITLSHYDTITLEAYFNVGGIFEASRGNNSIVRESLGNNRYLTKMYIIPKSSLTGKMYFDVCRVTGFNQRKEYLFEIPLKFSANHDFGDWQKTNFHTCNTNGFEIRVCLHCGFTETLLLDCNDENCNICGNGEIKALNLKIDQLKNDTTVLRDKNVTLQTKISNLQSDINDLGIERDKLLDQIENCGEVLNEK